MQQTLEIYKQEDIVETWEIIKRKCTEQLKQMGKERAQTKNAKLNRLKDDLVETGRGCPANIDSVHVYEQLAEINSCIEAIELEATRASIFRSKSRWYSEGEKNSKYFYGLEKRNFCNKYIKQLSKEGERVTERKQILYEMQQFYETVYTSQKQIEFSIVNTSGVTLKQQQICELDADIGINECYKALCSMKDGKSPGNDGLSCEFYKAMWTYIGPVLVKVYDKCINHDQRLNTSARQGLISLIPKKDKDPLLLKNWRPITLLNYDYKILAKVLALRMKGVLPDITWATANWLHAT